MAFIDKGWWLTCSLVDTGGNQTTREYQLTATDTADDITAIIADVQTIVTALVAASDCVLVKQSLRKDSVEDSVTLPAGNVNVEENAQISAKIYGTPNKSAVFEIPGPKSTAFLAPTGEGHNKVNFTTGPVPAYVNLFKNGAQALISDGEAITDQNIKGKRVHHKSTKG